MLFFKDECGRNKNCTCLFEDLYSKGFDRSASTCASCNCSYNGAACLLTQTRIACRFQLAHCM
jgi:hypothetical protein